MKTILTSIAAGSLLAMLAVAQPPRSAVDRARVFGQAEIQPASSKAVRPAPLYGRREFLIVGRLAAISPHQPATASWYM